MINWKVRIQSKTFWFAAISAAMLIIQPILGMFGIDIDTLVVQEELVNIVNAVFGLLVALGVVVDPTTVGLGDTERALSYQVPGSDLDARYVDDRRDPEAVVE